MRPADGCAMAEILVSVLCARRLSAAGDLFVGLSLRTRGCVSTRPDVRLFPLVRRVAFPLQIRCRFVVLLPAAFLKPSQGLGLQMARISACRSLVLFKKNFRGLTALLRHETRAWFRPRQQAERAIIARIRRRAQSDAVLSFGPNGKHQRKVSLPGGFRRRLTG